MGRRKEFQEEPYNIFEVSNPAKELPSVVESVVVKNITPKTVEKGPSLELPKKSVEVAQSLEIRDEARIRRSLTLESSEQDDEYSAFETRLRQKFGSGVSFSVLGRALFTALLRAEPQIVKSADRIGVPTSLDRKNVEKAAEYQEAWNRVVINALASAPPVAREG